MPDAAPFYAEVADGPEDVRAVWATAEDGVRLRVGIWPGGARGTVLLFAGRTEYLEKYGRTAADLKARGLATICIDWRGQGLADRPLDNPLTGHVMEFPDYQLDVEVLLRTARAEGLPEPYFLLAHSMGGCIGLRALFEGLPVNAVCFTAPMWGIRMHPALRPVAWGLSWASRAAGVGDRFVPGTGPAAHSVAALFKDNLLTTDPDMFCYMNRQVEAHPELRLSGPSLHWLYEALAETAQLAQRTSPSLPCLTFLGGNERIVPDAPIRDRMARWPGGRLDDVPTAEHEVLMETPGIRSHVLAGMMALFDAAR